MAREMNTIAFIYGKDKSRYMDFERFSCKRPETAARNMRELFESPLYKACNKGAEEIHIYRTPDHINESGEPFIITI